MPQQRKGELRIRYGLEEEDQEDQNTCYFQRFVKLLTIQGIWGRRLVSRRGLSNILSVVFMHFRMTKHALIRGINWGYKEIFEHCWWCIIPEPLHIKGKYPRGSTTSVLLRWGIFTCLNCVYLEPSQPLIKRAWHQKLMLSQKSNKIMKQEKWTSKPAAFQISFHVFQAGGTFP